MGQDLLGADFSHADIRGADFTNAVLTGADFSCAQAGLQQHWTISLEPIRKPNFARMVTE